MGRKNLVFIVCLLVVVAAIVAIVLFWKEEPAPPRGVMAEELKNRISYALSRPAPEQIELFKEIIERYKGVEGVQLAYFGVAEQSFLKGRIDDLKWATRYLVKNNPTFCRSQLAEKKIGGKEAEGFLTLQAVRYLEECTRSSAGEKKGYKEALEMRLAVLDALEKKHPHLEFRYLKGEALFLLNRLGESEKVFRDYVQNLGAKEPYYLYNKKAQQGLLNYEIEPFWAWCYLGRIYHKRGEKEKRERAFQNAFEALAKAEVPENFRTEIRKGVEAELEGMNK